MNFGFWFKSAISMIIMLFVLNASAKEYSVSSPNDKISIQLEVKDQIKWSVYFKGDMISFGSRRKKVCLLTRSENTSISGYLKLEAIVSVQFLC